FPWEKHGSCVDFEPGHFFHFAVFRLQQESRDAKKLRLVPGFRLSDAEQEQIFSKLLSARNRCFAAGPDLEWVVPRLVAELTHPGAMAETKIVALSQAALCELMKIVHATGNQNKKSRSSEQRVLQFTDELRLNCSHPWTLDSMAAACRLKRTQFE